MPEFNPKEYGDVHKRLVQAMISRGCIKGSNELKAIFTQCLVQSGHDVEHLVNESQFDLINSAAQSINTIKKDPKFKSTRLDIEKFISEYDGGKSQFYVLVSRAAGDWTKALSLQTETESEMLKLALSAITAAPTATISSVDFLNFVDDLKEKNRKIRDSFHTCFANIQNDLFV